MSEKLIGWTKGRITSAEEKRELYKEIHQGLHDYNSEKNELTFDSASLMEKSLTEEKFMEFSEKYGSICDLFEPIAFNAKACGRLYIATPESKTRISDNVFNLNKLNENGIILEELALQGMVQLINLKNNVYMVMPIKDNEMTHRYNDLSIKGINVLLKHEEHDKKLQKPTGYRK